MVGIFGAYEKGVVAREIIFLAADSGSRITQPSWFLFRYSILPLSWPGRYDVTRRGLPTAKVSNIKFGPAFPTTRSLQFNKSGMFLA